MKWLRDFSGWRDNRKDPGPRNVSSPQAEITSQRIGAFSRIEFDVPSFDEHE